MTEEYKNLVNHILQYGTDQSCRNGSQRIIPHYAFTLTFQEQDNHILKLRKMYYSGVVGEFDTLISPEPLTNVSQFEARGCNYWRGWADEDGSINIDYANQMHPQLERLIEQIKTDPNSRRHMLDLWNPENVQFTRACRAGKTKHAGARHKPLSLECCWHNLTFSIINGIVHLKWTQRSVDTMIGLPSDIFLAYKFMQYVAVECNLKMGTCLFSLSNVHIYAEHLENAAELLERTEDDNEVPLKFEVRI